MSALVKNGFSLIEFALYLGLLTVVVGISFVWLATLSGPVIKKQTILDSLIDLHLARDLMVADIERGTINPQRWKQTRDRLSWSIGDEDIAWELRNEKLYRTSGNYLVNTGQWSGKKQALMAQGITNFFAKIERTTDNAVKAVEVTIVGKNKDCTIFGFPFCGRKIG